QADPRDRMARGVAGDRAEAQGPRRGARHHAAAVRGGLAAGQPHDQLGDRRAQDARAVPRLFRRCRLRLDRRGRGDRRRPRGAGPRLHARLPRSAVPVLRSPPLKFLRRSWPWWVVLAVALAGLALWTVQGAREVEIVSVARGPVVQSIVATGRVDSPARVTISSQSAARIEAVLVREGDRVRAGQPLVRLRSDEAQGALDAARAALREAEGRQRQLEQVQRPVAEQQLAQARANLDAARRELERARELVAQGYVSQSRADEAQRQVDNARAALASTQAPAEGARERGIQSEPARA